MLVHPTAVPSPLSTSTQSACTTTQGYIPVPHGPGVVHAPVETIHPRGLILDWTEVCMGRESETTDTSLCDPPSYKQYPVM